MRVMEAAVVSAPRASTSRLSLRRTVPPARRASSKSSSVRERRREGGALAGDEPEWREEGKAEGGTGDRGEFCLKRWARMEETAAGQTRAVGGGQAAAWAVRCSTRSLLLQGRQHSRPFTAADTTRRPPLQGALRGGWAAHLVPVYCPWPCPSPTLVVRPHSHPFTQSLSPCSGLGCKQLVIVVALVETDCSTIIYNIYRSIVQRRPRLTIRQREGRGGGEAWWTCAG